MLKKLCCAVLAAAATTGAYAAETTWNFTYQGFLEVSDSPLPTEEWRPDRTLSGSFTGEDKDGNGIIALDEVSRFVSDGVTIIGNPTQYCMMDSYRFNCQVYNFSYKIGGELDYFVWYSSPDYFMWFGNVKTGDFYTDSQYMHYYRFTDETTFTISPVPEPSGALLLLAGLPLMAAVRRRAASRAAKRT